VLGHQKDITAIPNTVCPGEGELWKLLKLPLAVSIIFFCLLRWQ